MFVSLALFLKSRKEILLAFQPQAHCSTIDPFNDHNVSQESNVIINLLNEKKQKRDDQEKNLLPDSFTRIKISLLR